MQQLFLTGENASSMALRLFSALMTRPVGYRTLPFVLAGRNKGQLLHLLTLPAHGGENDLPCRLRLDRDRTVIVREPWDEIAAPALLRCIHMNAPILLDDLDIDVLSCPRFLEAVQTCLASPQPVIAVVRPEAVEAFRGRITCDAAWFPIIPGKEAILMAQLQEELSMRL